MKKHQELSERFKKETGKSLYVAFPEDPSPVKDIGFYLEIINLKYIEWLENQIL